MKLLIILNKDVVLLQRLISYPTRFGLVLRSSLYIIILVTSKMTPTKQNRRHQHRNKTTVRCK